MRFQPLVWGPEPPKLCVHVPLGTGLEGPEKSLAPKMV